MYLFRYMFFPFDDYDYRNENPIMRDLTARRLESLAAADELRRVAARNEERFWLTDPDNSRRHQDDVNEQDDRDARNLPQGADLDRRHQRSFDSLGGGLIPIKKQFDSLGGGVLPIKRSSSDKSDNRQRTVGGESAEDLQRQLNMMEKQFDTLGGGHIPPRNGLVDVEDKSVAENSRDEFDVRRRNFDSLGGGLLPI